MKYNKNECRLSYSHYFPEKTIVAKSLDSKFSNERKQEVLTWRNTLPRQVKSYTDNNLNPAKVNVSPKDNFTQPLSVKEVLDELAVSKDDYYRALLISKDENLELHLKREPNSCFVNNYFDVGLKAWQANTNMQPVFNMSIRQYISAFQIALRGRGIRNFAGAEIFLSSGRKLRRSDFDFSNHFRS